MDERLTLYSCMNASSEGTESPTSFMIDLNWFNSFEHAGVYLFRAESEPHHQEATGRQKA